MKRIILSASLLFSFSALAFIEVECISEEHREFLLQIEKPFPNNSAFRRAQFNMDNASFFYTLTRSRVSSFNRIRYIGGGLDLQIDTWPDNAPTWGRSYRSYLSVSNPNWDNLEMECRFL